jgi:hypothetical protein
MKNSAGFHLCELSKVVRFTESEWYNGYQEMEGGGSEDLLVNWHTVSVEREELALEFCCTALGQQKNILLYT